MEPIAQCKVCLSYLDVGIVYRTCEHFLRDDTKENKKYMKLVLDLFRFTTSTSGKVDHMVTDTGRRGSRVLHRESAQEEMQEERILEHSRSYPSVMRDSESA